MKFALSILSIAILCGCAGPTNRSDIAIDAGPSPTAAAAEAAILQHLRANLKDPDSLKQFAIRTMPTYFTWYTSKNQQKATTHHYPRHPGNH